MIEFIECISIFIQNHTEMMYMVAFFAAMAEGTIFLALVPGSTFILSLGAFAANGDLSFAILFIVVVIGAFLGDNLGYLIGRFFGRNIMKFEWIDKKYYVFTESFLLQHGRKSIFFARFISGIKEIAPFIAGVMNMNRKSFAVWNLVGGFFWAILWLGSGYIFGQDLNSVTGILKGIAILGLIGFFSCVTLFYLKNRILLQEQKFIIDEILKKEDE